MAGSQHDGRSDVTRGAVIVPTLGLRPEWLRLAISSVQGQAGGLEPLVICPAGSAAVDISKSMGARALPFDRPGLSAAINYGVAHLSEAEVIGWLADDDVLAPGSYERALAVFTESKNIVYVFGRIRYIDANGDTLWMLRPGSLGLRYARYGQNFVAQPGSFFRRSAFLEAGGLDESLTNSMDQALMLRLARLGSTRYIAVEQGAFRVHDTSITASKSSREDESPRVRRQTGSRIPAKILRPLDRAIGYTLKRIPPSPLPHKHGVAYTKSAVTDGKPK